MQVSVTEARKRLSRLIRAMEDGEDIVITRNGKAVARLIPPARKARFGSMRGRIHLKPGWDAPITEEQVLKGDF